ncbi:hypothetical protein SAMN04487979_12422 [Flavobacterium sp. ov086]|nr:hypothetical protein SAMN04487979_12422 [Flavobacterium sp. ov086]
MDMESLVFWGFILLAMFLIGLVGLIFSKENKKFFLTLLLIPIIIVVIGFGTCVVIMSNL